MIAPFKQNITFLYTQNMAQTARFYEDVLGLPLARDQGTCRIYRISQNGFIGFCQHLAVPQNPGAIILTFVTDDVDGWYQRLMAKGVVFEKPPAQNEKFHIYHCFLRDPNQYLLEIQCFIQPL